MSRQTDLYQKSNSNLRRVSLGENRMDATVHAFHIENFYSGKYYFLPIVKKIILFFYFLFFHSSRFCSLFGKIADVRGYSRRNFV
jgi:hypothetical protein